MELGDITIPNYRITLLMEKMELLIDLSISFNDDLKNKYKQCAQYYREFVKIMIQKDEFSDDDIANYQQNVDSFMKIWCSMGGRRMMTNYFHMLASGHVKYYMKEWGNLYRYEQEGWESLNALIKTKFFRHTKRGGFVCKDSDTDKKVLSNRAGALGKWIVRNLLWRSGKAFECKSGKFVRHNNNV